MRALAHVQEDFLACVLDDAAPLPAEWDARRAAGMAVYRNAYRARLVDALRDTFERTARLVGDDAFQQAAAHHLITHRPEAWTIDLAGDRFPETCAQLFASDPDVPEVAWLEWAMHSAFTAADCEPLTITEFAEATADFEPEQWEALRLELVPGTALCRVTHDPVKLWEALGEPSIEPRVDQLPDPACVLVWREGERPVCLLLSEAEGGALAQLQRGSTFGDVCAGLSENLDMSDAAAAAGAMLFNWMALGVIRQIFGCSQHLTTKDA